MSSRANDRGANQVPSPANYGDPSMEPPSPSSESSVRKKQRRSKLRTTSISNRPRCQNRRSSQGAFRKVPGAPDNARRGATQEPDHDALVGLEETQPMASDLASIVSGKIRTPRHSYDRIGDKHHVSRTRTKRAGLSSAAEPPSSLSSLDIPPELRESRHELDRRTKYNPSTRGDKTTDPVGRLLEAPQATSPLPLASLQGSISPPPTQARGSDVLHESLERVTRCTNGSLIPSASSTNLIPTPAVVPATIVSSPGVTRNTRDTCSVKREDHLPGRRDDNKDATNSSIALTATNGDVNLIGGCRRTDGTVNLESEGAPTIISAVAPLSEAGAQASATTNQLPDTALEDMANPPTLLGRLLNPLRKRAHFGSVTHRLLSPRSTTTVTATPHKNRSWSFSTDDKWPQITVVTALAIAATLVMYSLLHGTTGSGGGDTSGNSPTLCQTTDCIQHADLFAHWLNTSIDPCEDFAAFVCSAWSHRAQYRRGESTSVRQEVVLDFTEKLAETIGAGMTWQLPLWFNVLVLPELAGGHRAVLIADNPQMHGWEARHKGLEATNSTFEYWSAHYEALTPPGNATTPQPPSRSQCEERTENLFIASTATNEDAKLVNIEKIQLGGNFYNVNGNIRTPDDVSSGVINGVIPGTSTAELMAGIRTPARYTVLHARMLGQSSAAVVFFEGPHVPFYKIFQSVDFRCRPYRKSVKYCRTCGTTRHRQNICPKPIPDFCYKCGNAGQMQGHECKPTCKICGEGHETASKECKRRLKPNPPSSI
ncbi:hypothetical protein HPB51_009485 [Rhipicephalus microplus]|uniref:Uncharacterized protein n=1 Tax=Rhipicephalus microplus TaxID=6941 RepID=A0A9J6DUA9_RHIMP|nr:hypothetical protein HPB51_009485 [Rhipicephalus microplus]